MLSLAVDLETQHEHRHAAILEKSCPYLKCDLGTHNVCNSFLPPFFFLQPVETSFFGTTIRQRVPAAAANSIFPVSNNKNSGLFPSSYASFAYSILQAGFKLHPQATMSRQTSDGSEGVIHRKMIFCQRLQEWEPARLMQICECCANFFVHCCGCDTGEWHKVAALGFQGSVSLPLNTSTCLLTRNRKRKQSGRLPQPTGRPTIQHVITTECFM